MTSLSVGVRRNARVARPFTMDVAHAASSASVVGRHMKIFRRLTVSEMPVTRCGPTTARLRRCGKVVMPTAMPISVSAIVCSIGATRSLTGPSNRWMKAAVTRWGPADTCTGGVLSDRLDVVSFMRGSMSKIATRSPLIETSICSPGVVLPNSMPSGSANMSSRKT